MNMKSTHVMRKHWRAVALLAVPSLLGLPAFGQAAADDKKDEALKLEKFVVTGSYIPYAADAPATAVQVMSAEDIKKTGMSDLLEVLRKAVPQIIGGGNLGSSNSNIGGGSTNGGSVIALRNTATLVLINGRRAAFSPVSATGGFTFVDVGAIPASAVQSIEIITDGASALYGSDAVSGVVNIKLKPNFEGVEIGGGYKWGTQAGHWAEREAHFSIGGNAGKTSLVVSGEWVKTDPIMQFERDASSPSFGTPTFPGVVQVGGTTTGSYYILNPSLNAPPANLDLTPAQLVAQGIYTVNPAGNVPYNIATIVNVFDLSRAVTLTQQNQKKTLTAAFEHKFDDTTTFFGDILYAKTANFYQINAQPLTDPTLQTHAANDPRNPFNITVRARNRFVDYPRQYFSDTHSFRALGGFRGQFSNGINWEVAFNHNQVDQLYRNKNVINTANLVAAVNAGTINLFARNQAPGAIDNANIFGTAYANNVSKLNALDARIFGDLPFELPAGSAQFALGAERRREDLASQPDAGSLPNGTSGSPRVWTDATTFQEFSASRTIDSIFAEVRFPLASPKQGLSWAHTADIDIAVRRDAYSDNESPVVPKVLLRWLPFSDDLAFRVSYSKSFIAPTLFQINGPSGYGVTPAINNINNFGGGVTGSLGQLNYVAMSNRNLKSQHSTNYNYGVVWSPRNVKGLNVELSYFDLELTDIVGAYNPTTMVQDVELNGPTSVYAQYIAFGAFPGTPGAVPVTTRGQMINAPNDIYINGVAVNLAKQTQSGVDFAVKYDFTVENLGRFSATLNGVWYNSYKTHYPEQVIESVGWDEATNFTIPEWLATAQIDFSRENWGLGLGAQYIGAVDEVVIPDVVGHQASFVSVDARASYAFTKGFLNGFSLVVGANNVFDKGPPLAPTVNSNANYDATTYTAATFGRVIYVSGTYKF
jgi:iron complex outermembrane receptor protein